MKTYKTGINDFLCRAVYNTKQILTIQILLLQPRAHEGQNDQSHVHRKEKSCWLTKKDSIHTRHVII
jgi:hypothetical protein